MTSWTETDVRLPFMITRTKARTNGEVWQIRNSTSIYMPSGKLADFMDELAEIRERLFDAEVSVTGNADEYSVEIQITGWREAREEETAMILGS